MGTSSSKEHTKDGNKKMREMRPAPRWLFSLSLILLESMSNKSRLRDRTCASCFLYLNNALNQKNITI